MYIPDRFVEVLDFPEVIECNTQLRRCVELGDLNVFNEIMTKKDHLILEFILGIK